MKHLGKRNLLGVLVDAVDYDAAVDAVIRSAVAGRPFALTALAVHGVMIGVGDGAYRAQVNTFDLVTPDGQPVRWALNLLYRTGLRDRVYGPDLTRMVLARAAEDGLPVYFYGSTEDTLLRLRERVAQRWPQLVVAGAEPSKFRVAQPGEATEIARRITSSGARIVFVGLGCPRQEQFVAAMRRDVARPLLAVGAAFDYLAGTLAQPPPVLQRHGLEWLWRLSQEPRRLWRRYLLLNPAYVTLFLAQAFRMWRPTPTGRGEHLSCLPV